MGTTGVPSGTYFTDIQSAVDAAVEGDVVLVSNGMYSTGMRVTPGNSLSNRVVINKRITVRSVDGPENTVITGMQSPYGGLSSAAVRCVYMFNGTLDGFTLSNGFTMNTGEITPDTSGGGLFATNACVITNCIISYNSAFAGAGIMCAGKSKIYNTVIENNYCPWLGEGGGVFGNDDIEFYTSIINSNTAFVFGGVRGEKTIYMDMCTLYYNSAVYGAGGSACLGTSVYLNTHAINNDTHSGAGAIGCSTYSFISNCFVSGNSSYGTGGIFMYGYGVVTDSIISNNISNFSGSIRFYDGGELLSCDVVDNISNGDGGGVYLQGGANNSVIRQCTISGNLASYKGGGVYSWSHTLIEDCDIKNNYSEDGGGLYLFQTSILSNNIVNNNTAGKDGGGILSFNKCSVYNCDFIENTASNFGGGVFTYYDGYIENCTFISNSALYGGGCAGNYRAMIENSTIAYNSACNGGGAYYYDSCTINDCTLNMNTATNYGGGVYCQKDFIVSHSTMISNTADKGAGAYIDEKGVINNSFIQHNSSSSDGGGVYLYRGGAITNCLLSHNSSLQSGGGAYINWSGKIINCTLADNTAHIYGGGIACTNGGEIINTIIYDNSDTSGNSNWWCFDDLSYASFTYCCTYPVNGIPDGSGCISNAPHFIVPHEEYQLEFGSPCIDTGYFMSWMTDATDVAGNPRLSSLTIDIGAYEFVPDVIVTITNGNTTIEGNILTCSIGGISSNVVSLLTWENKRNGSQGTIPFSDYWRIDAIPLEFGANIISVQGTNVEGMIGYDSVVITRKQVPEGDTPIHYVSQDGNNLWPFTNWYMAAHSIQDAIGTTMEGDIVLVSNGIYKTGETITPGTTHSNRIYINKDITVRSLNGPEETVISGEQSIDGGTGTGAVRCVFISGATLEGFTLSNGYTQAYDVWEEDCYGGALLAISNVVISNCVIIASHAQHYGGGAYIEYNCTVYDSDFINNTAEYNGGGMYCDRNCNIYNCTIRDNYAENGGGMYTDYDIIVSQCNISENYASENGGGIYSSWGRNTYYFDSIISGNSAELSGGGMYGGTISLISGCTFRGNSSLASGGGMRCSAVDLITNCTFIGNSASDGGGVYGSYDSLFDGCRFITNIAQNSGGGIYIDDNIQLKSCVIASNVVQKDGGGVYAYDISEIEDCHIFDNISSRYGGGAYLYNETTVSHSEIVRNKAQSSGGGIGVYKNIAITDSLITSNVAELHGGGVYGHYYKGEWENRYLDITHCEISANIAGRFGGGIDTVTFDDNYECASIRHCLVQYNSAEADGGGMRVGEYGHVSYCIISNNTSANNGGGVSMSSGGSLTNCLIVFNTSGYEGGGLYLQSSEKGCVINCTIANNYSARGIGGVYISDNGRIINSIIYDNAGTNWMALGQSASFHYCCTAPTNNLPDNSMCIPANPLLSADNRFYLLEGSPCINAGTNMEWMVNCLDSFGHLRVIDDTVDIGYYEFVPEPSLFMTFLLYIMYLKRKYEHTI